MLVIKGLVTEAGPINRLASSSVSTSEVSSLVGINKRGNKLYYLNHKFLNDTMKRGTPEMSEGKQGRNRHTCSQTPFREYTEL